MSVLMGLFRRYILREVEELDSHDIRVRFIGQRERMPADLQRLMAQTEERTRMSWLSSSSTSRRM
ncbi:MAG: undecaprenyl diphosphate synthase family protein [Pseudomonadota bacterium]